MYMYVTFFLVFELGNPTSRFSCMFLAMKPGADLWTSPSPKTCFRPKHYLFLALTTWLLCLNLTRAQAQCFMELNRNHNQHLFWRLCW